MSEKSKNTNPTVVKLANVRLSFPSLGKPRAYGNSDQPKYSAQLLIDPDTKQGSKTLDAIEDAIEYAINEKFGGKKPKFTSDKKPLRDGNDRIRDDGSVYDGYEDMYYLVASSNEEQQPLCVYRKNVIRDSSEITRIFYGGCYVNAIVRIWVQDNNFGRRVNCQLSGVEFYSDGEPFGQSGATVSDFDFNDPDDDDSLSSEVESRESSRSKRRRDDEDEEDTRRKSRNRRRDDDDEDEEDSRSKSRKNLRDDDDEEDSRSKSRKRRRDDDDDDDDEDTRRKGRPSSRRRDNDYEVDL